MAKREKRAAGNTGAGKRASAKLKGSGPKAQKKPAATKAKVEAKPQISWETGKEAAPAREHTKTGDERATIRATSSGHWTNRQKGKG